MTQDVYEQLRVFLDNLPGGYPATENGIELEILRRLFTEEQAHLTLKLTPIPETISQIAERTGIDRQDALPKYEEMAKEGLIFRIRFGDQVAFNAMNFIIGIYEFQLNSLDQELAELIHQYLPILWNSNKNVNTKGVRIIPVAEAIESTSNVASYDQIREMAQKCRLISVAPCICQKEMGLIGETCDKSLERCFQFDMTAEYYIENGMSRRIELDEFMEILAKGNGEGLVLEPMNTKDLMGLCMCCDCCCPSIRMLKSQERPIDYVRTSFQAEIDEDLCNSCGTCEERCPLDAPWEDDKEYEIQEARCIGCGVCVSTCPEEAISLVALPDPKPVPENIIELGMNILKDRGLL